MTAKLPPRPPELEDWCSLSSSLEKSVDAFAIQAVRDALSGLVKKARANDWIEPTGEGPILTIPEFIIDALLKEYIDE